MLRVIIIRPPIRPRRNPGLTSVLVIPRNGSSTRHQKEEWSCCGRRKISQLVLSQLLSLQCPSHQHTDKQRWFSSITSTSTSTTNKTNSNSTANNSNTTLTSSVLPPETTLPQIPLQQQDNNAVVSLLTKRPLPPPLTARSTFGDTNVGPIVKRNHPDESRQKHTFPLAELRERTMKLKQWCKDAHAKRMGSRQRKAAGESSAAAAGGQRPPTTEFFLLLEAWMEQSKQQPGVLTAAREAYDLYTVLQTTVPAKYQLTLHHLDVVLEACASCGGERAALLAENAFVRSLSPPSTKTYNILMKCWARSESPEAGKKVDWLLKQMLEADNCAPTNYTITSYMVAWANSGDEEAPERVGELVWRILHEHSQHNSNNDNNNDKNSPPRMFRDVTLDATLFHGVLRGWATSGRGRPAALEAERVLTTMHQYGCQPTVISYSFLASAWADCERMEKTGDAALRAEMILNAMVQQQLGPNAVIFTTCIAAWSRATENRVAPERAEALLRQLKQLYHESGNDKAYEPSVEAENAVLSAWARSNRPDAVSRIQRYLSSMTTPDLVSYNTVLDCYASQGKSQEALQLFEQMKQHQNVALRPDVVSYNSVLNAMVRASTPIEEIEKFLHEMEDVLSPVEPDKFSYTCVLDAWAKSSHPDKVIKCKRIVDIMVYRYVKRKKERSRPDAFVFTNLIKACVNTEDPRSLTVATEAIERLQTQFQPANDVAYIMYLRALTKFSGTVVQLNKAIKKCAQGGWLSNGVVRELGKATNITKDPLSSLKEYEPSWSRNVRERDRPRFQAQPISLNTSHETT